MSLLAVGTVAFDDIETPFGRAEKVVGGACTYISLAASYFTKPIRIVSVVGDDFPEDMLRYMEHRGVELDGLQIKVGEKSFFGRVVIMKTSIHAIRSTPNSMCWPLLIPLCRHIGNMPTM